MRRNMSRILFSGFVLSMFLTIGLSSGLGHAGSEPEFSTGQTVYVPVYSNVYIGNRETPLNLSANVSVRNTDPAHPITVLSADYYDTDGSLVKKYLTKPNKLKPLGSVYFFVKTSDSTGGWGANFIIRWQSDTDVSLPIIESLMSGTSGTHAFTYSSRGEPIRDAAE